MGSRLSTNDNEVKSVKDKQNSQQLSADSLALELTQIKANVTELFQLVNSSGVGAGVDQNSRLLSDLSENMTHLQTFYTNLINWKTGAEEELKTLRQYVQHIHEKLHNQSIADSSGSQTSGQTTAGPHVVSHNRKQSASDEPMAGPPIEGSTLASNLSIV